MSVTGDEAEVVAPRPRRRVRRRRTRRWITISVLTAMVIIVAFGAWYEVSAHGFGGPGSTVSIDVSTGETASQVASQLEAKGVLSSAFGFRLYNELHGGVTIVPGWYSAPKNSTFGAVHELLSSGPNSVALIVPSGFTLHEVNERVASETSSSFARSFQRALLGGGVSSPFEPAGSSDLEGLVAPGTYLITPTTSGRSVVQSMVSRFVVMAAREGLTPSTTRRGHDAYALVTIASIVEKEGYQVRNMGRVSQVIFNRLEKSIPLQMDSTVLYAIGQDGGPVTRATEQIASPYNTYLNQGLPPTPICVVSAPALHATISPTPGAWLYFTVIDKTGTEAFSDTFAQQLANEQRGAENGV